MTDPNQPQSKVAPETLALRAPPPRVGRISRTVLIGSATIGLAVLSGIVLFALDPPSLRVAAPTELVTVTQKSISDGLSRLPATYDGLRTAPPLREPKPIAKLQRHTTDLGLDGVTEEMSRIARMASQARESPVLFRLQPIASIRASAPRNAPSDVAQSQATRPAAEVPSPMTAFQLNTGDPGQMSGGDQLRKLTFLNTGPEKETYNPHALQRPASPHQLMAGTIIAASLVTGLNSDLPGFVIAQVTENVFDSVSGRYLLIPQGSRLIGKYDTIIAFGENRALLVWQRIILPDGSSVVLDNLPATDTAGYAGLSDQVDLHTWQLLEGVALSTVLGVGQALAFGPAAGDSDLVKALKQSTGQTTNQTGQRLVERQMTVQPTLTVRPGWPLRVIVHKDLVLKPYRSP